MARSGVVFSFHDQPIGVVDGPLEDGECYELKLVWFKSNRPTPDKRLGVTECVVREVPLDVFWTVTTL